MQRSLTVLLLLVLSLFASAQADTITVGALERTFTVRLPSNYDGTTVLPLVIAMHGGFGSGVQLESQSQLSVKAEAEGFIMVYPDGVPSPLGIRTWNAGGCCAYAMDNNIDDVGFINALLDTLIDTCAIDTQRIYATGMSNGGFMSYRLACELSERIAAIAPVSASMTITVCEPARPMPVLGIHSYMDNSVPYAGGIGDGASDHYNSPQDSVHTAFALHANCTVLNDTIQNDTDVTVVRWHECDCEQEILLYMTHDGGHSWPGGQQTTGFSDPPSQVINANDLMWAFFQQYTLDCATTDVREEAQPALSVAPNPTSATIVVSGGDAMQRLQVLDLRGSVMLDLPMNGSTKAALDVSMLPQGSYTLRVMDASGTRTTRFVLVGN